MRVGLFAKCNHGGMSRLAAGARQIGLEPVWCAPKYWAESNYDESLGLIVTLGTKLHSKRIADCYRAAGVPVLAMDLPAIRPREFKYPFPTYALWRDSINNIPQGVADDSRLFIADPKPPRGKLGRRILVCGQKADDAAHGMGTAELREYFRHTVRMIRDKHGDARPIIWRAHPEEPFPCPDAHDESEATEGPLEDLLAERSIGAVVTFNSTCGITALASRLPVFCDEQSFYAEVANTGLPNGRDVEPNWDKVDAFLSRVAWTQFTLDELESGYALAHVLSGSMSDDPIDTTLPANWTR